LRSKTEKEDTGMGKLCRFAACMAVFVWVSIGYAFAGEVDALLQKLIDKGILTASEAQEIRTETNEAAVKADKQKQGDYKKLASGSAPNIKLKGDLRLRSETGIRENANNINGSSGTRQRERIRFRVGADAEVNDEVKAYFGLASGENGDPRSTNQTLTESFAKKPAWIDYAYASYQPAKWATFLGGKMKNVVWEPNDMLWDTDINPEGLSFVFNKSVNPNLDLFTNMSALIINENAAGSDPWMGVIQPGFNWKIADNVSLKGATALYGFKHLKGSRPSWTSGGNNYKNTAGTNTGLEFDYNSINPSAEMTFKDPLAFLNVYSLNIPYLAVFGEAQHNFDAKYSRNGWTGGVKFGYEKVTGWGRWQARYNYVLLESQAWPDFLPDSDRYSGRTGIRSNEFALSYGLGKNWTLDLDYYLSGLTASPGANDHKMENLFQADINFKF